MSHPCGQPLTIQREEPKRMKRSSHKARNASSQLGTGGGKPSFPSPGNPLKSWSMGFDYHHLNTVLWVLGSLRRNSQEILFAPQPLKGVNSHAYPRRTSPPSRLHLCPGSEILFQVLGETLEPILLNHIKAHLEDPKWVFSPSLPLESLFTTKWLLQMGNQVPLMGWTYYSSTRTEISFFILSTLSPWFFLGQVLHTADQLTDFHCIIFTSPTVI